MEDDFDPTLDDPRSVQMASAMRSEGIDPYDKVQVDYFAIGDDVKTYLPDGISWVTHKQLNEGDRKKYLQAVNRDLKIQKGTGDAIMRLAAGEDRTAMLRCAITGWNLVRAGEPVPFDQRNIDLFLNGPIAILEIVEREVRKNNPWLLNDATVEDIDAEIEQLQEQRQQIVDREAGKGDSVS